MNKNWSIVIILLFIMLSSCEKEQKKDVVYQVSNNTTGFLVHYRNSGGTLIKTDIDVESKEDMWQYKFEADQGDIVFVSALYNNPADAIKIQVLINGKVYKQGSSIYDTLNFVTVSGTVPFE